jgi:hypothetical protein
MKRVALDQQEAVISSSRPVLISTTADSTCKESTAADSTCKESTAADSGGMMSPMDIFFASALPLMVFTETLKTSSMLNAVMLSCIAPVGSMYREY